MRKISCITFPRSGHHLLVDLLTRYFGDNPTKHPKTFFNKYGFVMCMGLSYFKGNYKNTELFNSMLTKMSNDSCDQHRFNMELLEKDLIIKGNPSEGFYIDVNSSLKIKVIGKNVIARVKKNKNKDTKIYHPLTPKGVLKKIRFFKRINLFIV